MRAGRRQAGRACRDGGDRDSAAARGPNGAGDHLTIGRTIVTPGSVTGALEPLGLACKLDRYGPNARMMLEPWAVEAALAELGEQRLTPAEQATVVRVTRTPHKVRWPDWWAVKP